MGDRDGEWERHVLRVPAGGEGERLDRYLAGHLPLSRSRLQGLIDAGRVTVDGRPVKKSHPVTAGERVEVSVPPPPEPSLAPEALPVEILHEDEDIAVVVKPSGMVVHPAPGHESGTLVNALLHHLDRLSSLGGDTRPGIVHRLDRETSGLLVVAKTDPAHNTLSEALARRRVRRGYLAGAWGHLDDAFAEAEGDVVTVDRPLGRDPDDRTKRAVVEGGKRAVTHLKRLERWISADFLAVRLETGRTHQIRVHLRSLGHPVVRDETYGPGWERGFVGAGGRWAEAFAERCGRLFLHAARLSFLHPRTGERMTFTSELPEPLAGAVAWARDTSAPGGG